MENRVFDVLIVGGSAAGLSAALTLGRSLRSVMIIDNCDPCNQNTPHSHNFLSRDGASPKTIIEISKEQVLAYPNVQYHRATARKAAKTDDFFTIETDSGEEFRGEKLLLATGLKDLFPDIDGFEACWGKTILHCPYCHGYEVRNQPTAIIANGEAAYHLGVMIKNWTNDVTILTNGISELRFEEAARLEELGITIVEKEISRFLHDDGYLRNIEFTDGSDFSIGVVYASIPFEQKSDLAEQLECKISSHNHIEVDDEQRTSIEGVFAAGDCTAQPRAISFAVSSGAKAGFTINLEKVLKEKMPSDK